MKVSLLSRAVLVLSILTACRAFPGEMDTERANLAEAIESALKGSALKSPTDHSGSSTSQPEVPIPSAPSESEMPPTPTPTAPQIIPPTSTEASVAVVPTEPPAPTVVIYQPNTNLFGTGSPTGTLGGVISEAFKLAQVAIAVFGQNLILGPLTGISGTLVTISNSTRLIGL